MTIQKTTSAIIVAAAMGISAFAASVQAEAGNPLCTGYSKSCVYLDAGYNGLFGTKNGGSGLSNISTTNNDKMSSWENKSSSNGAWYYNQDGGTPCKNMPRISEQSYSWLDGVNDNMSSWRMNGSC